jgi:hypothetical protein
MVCEKIPRMAIIYKNNPIVPPPFEKISGVFQQAGKKEEGG